MKGTLEVIEYAKQYLWEGLPEFKKQEQMAKGNGAKEQKLNRALQYRLCDSIDRIIASFGEITRKDVCLLIESWIMAQGNLKPQKALESMEYFQEL